jgi:TolB-like protein
MFNHYQETNVLKPPIAFTKNIFWVLSGFILMLCLFANSWAAPTNVAIIPFQIYSDKDLSYLQNGLFDMLTTRLHQEGKVAVVSRNTTDNALASFPGEMNEKLARDLGSKLMAQYVLYGSLTVLGDSVSIDLKMLNLLAQNPPQTFFAQAEAMDKVIPQVNELAEQINETYFGVKRTRVAQTSPAPAAPTGSDSHAHPEKALEAELLGEDGEPLDPYLDYAGEGVLRGAGFKRIHRLGEKIIGISSGDVDGEPGAEVVLISSRKVHVYQYIAPRLAKIAEFESERYLQFLAVDTADVNENGQDEIFITARDVNSGYLKSLALELNRSRLTAVAQDLNWYFRVIDNGIEGRILVGQTRGIKELFSPGIYRMGWNGGQYVQQDKLPLPRGFRIFGFAIGDVADRQVETVAAFDGEDRIRLFTLGGESLWKSDDRYGGTENNLPYPDEKSPSSADISRGMYLAQRILLAQTAGSSKKGLLVVKNEGTTGRLFKNFRMYTKGWVEVLVWDGLGMVPVWRTRKISGYVSDYYSEDLDGDGLKEVLAVVVVKRGSDFHKGDSAIILISMKNLDLELFDRSL